MCRTTAWISAPNPITNPVVLLFFNSLGLLVVVVVWRLGAIVLTTVCCSPLSVSKATPASTNGLISGVDSRYFANKGNSQALPVVRLLVHTSTRLKLEL